MGTPGSDGRGSVRRHLSALVAANLLVVLVLGIAGIVSTLRAHDSVQYLTEQVEPATRANAGALQAVTDAETYVWGYSISTDPLLLTKYHDAVAKFRAQLPGLLAARSLDGEVALLVDDFLLATQNWFTAYADPRIGGDVGADTFEPGRFGRGVTLFAEVRATNHEVTGRLQELSREADAVSHRRVNRIIAVLVATLVAAGALSFLVGRRAARRVTDPLGDLEQTAERLAAGEHTARAPVDGPREVALVARAMNRVADENDRARAVEARVVEQLRALDAVKSDFVSNVSHELRTPLTSILGYLELLEEELVDGSGRAEGEMVAAAKRNVLRLGDLIDDLLALTRSEAKRTVLEPVDLAQLVHDVVTDLRVASSQHGVDIRLGVPGAAVPVLADPGQIARVVTNLVSNAVKFSGGESEVAVTVLSDGDEAVITVEDHGIGIPAEELDQLGSRFYRASNAVGLGITGTGLGLRIVQAIVENHHGSVDLRSTQGVGTTVWVRIPIMAAAAAPVADPDPGPAGASAEPVA